MGDWVCTEKDVSLGGGGLDKYVEIPEGITAFEVTFSKDQPDGDDFFEIEGNSLVTEDSIDFFEYTHTFIGDAYSGGYRYLNVRF